MDSAVRVCYERVLACLCELRGYGLSRWHIARTVALLLWRKCK